MYATIADMTARFEAAEIVQAVDGDAIDDPLVVDRVETALARAKAMIDGYVAARYQLGTQPVPPLLVELACDLARHSLYRDAPPETVIKARDAAIATLKDIAKGVIKLDAGAEQLPERPGAILMQRPERVFGRENTEGY